MVIFQICIKCNHSNIVHKPVWYINQSMNSGTKLKPKSSSRYLHAWEIAEARRVFNNQLSYERIRIHENVSWPDTVNKIGAFLKRTTYVAAPNAVTLGDHIYFPVKLVEKPIRVEHPEHYKISWLMHELTHVWQYQCMGWRYLFKALSAQFRYGETAYDFGGEEGLKVCQIQGWTLDDFNLEQQGDIARSYYERICKGIDVNAWQPFINEIKKDD